MELFSVLAVQSRRQHGPVRATFDESATQAAHAYFQAAHTTVTERRALLTRGHRVELADCLASSAGEYRHLSPLL